MIETLKRLSPVPINFKKMNSMGLYHHINIFMSYSSHIEISNSLGKYRRMSVLAHEVGHAQCDAKNCNCMINRNNHTLAEMHAFKFALNWLLKHKQKRALKVTINNINMCAGDPDHYAKAAKHIMKLKLWQKCLNFVNNP